MGVCVAAQRPWILNEVSIDEMSGVDIIPATFLPYFSGSFKIKLIVSVFWRRILEPQDDFLREKSAFLLRGGGEYGRMKGDK